MASVRPKAVRSHAPPSRLQYSGAERPARCLCAQPSAVHQRGSSYPPSAMNSAYAPQVTGAVSMKNGATCTVCAGRSLSSAHGCVEVPIVNGPPGTMTSGGSRNASAGAGGGGAAARTGAPARIWWVISMVSSCCTSCWAIMPNANPPSSRREPVKPGALEQVEHAAAYLVAVGPRLVRGQQRQRRALGTRMLERVVERVDLRVHRLPAAYLAKQPQFLLVGHVGEVPDQRRHQRRVLRYEVGLIHAAGEQTCPLPCARQFPGDPLTQVGLRHVIPSSWSSAGHRPAST